MVKIKLENMMQKDQTYAFAVVTENRFFHQVYKRKYFLKVLDIDHESIAAEVSSVDYVPSGYKSSDSDLNHGVHVFTYENLDDVNETGMQLWKTIIGKIDPEFLEHVG